MPSSAANGAVHIAGTSLAGPASPPAAAAPAVAGPLNASLQIARKPHMSAAPKSTFDLLF